MFFAYLLNRAFGANKNRREATPALNSQISILNSFLQEPEAVCDNQSKESSDV